MKEPWSPAALRRLAVLAAFVTAAPLAASNGPPRVSHVSAERRPDASGLVDIAYDLMDGEGDSCTVTLLASGDGGATWVVAGASATGAVGSGIPPGTEKHIVWNPAQDIPGGPGSPFNVWVAANDGLAPAFMVQIPGGEFEMGNHDGGANFDELPVHAVYVSPFHMDVYEVTNRRYCAFLNAAYSQGLIVVADGKVRRAGGSEVYCDTTLSSPSSRITWNGSEFGVVAGKKDHPMVMVSWYGAAAYANWRSAREGRTPCYDMSTWECSFAPGSYRLPTEAEWEYAARGGERDPYYTYPWGNEIDGSKANYWSSGDPYETGSKPYTTPVGYYDGGQTPPGADMANGYGLYDAAGNAWEWCNDWYAAAYYVSSPCDNPRGPEAGTERVLRGGSWSRTPEALRCAYRFHDIPRGRHYNPGFRLVVE